MRQHPRACAFASVSLLKRLLFTAHTYKGRRQFRQQFLYWYWSQFLANVLACVTAYIVANVVPSVAKVAAKVVPMTLAMAPSPLLFSFLIPRRWQWCRQQCRFCRQFRSEYKFRDCCQFCTYDADSDTVPSVATSDLSSADNSIISVTQTLVTLPVLSQCFCRDTDPCVVARVAASATADVDTLIIF